MGNYRKWGIDVNEKKDVKSKPLVFFFLTVFSSFLFLILISLIFLYIAGNYRGFLDENLVIILKASVAVTIILFLISIVSFFVDFYLLVIKRRFLFFLAFLLSFLFIVVSVFFAVVDTLIIVIS